MKQGETIKARFVGANGSLGYQRGRVYKLRIDRHHPKYPVVIFRLSGAGWCPYSSEEAFQKNWEVPSNETG